MAAPKRTTKEREHDLPEIADMYLKGWTQVHIAEELAKLRNYEVTQQIISRDLKTIQSRWVKSSLFDYDTAKAQEIAKIDHLERFYWQEYRASKDPAIKRKTAKTVDDHITEVTQEVGQGTGDIRFLTQGVQWCIDRRIKILGLDTQIGDNDEKPFIIKVLRGVSMDDL